MANPFNKREYNQARGMALKELAKRYQDEYEQLMAQYLGRNLNQESQKAVRSRRDRDG